MTHIIAVINQKGGVGKTATSVNMAYELSKKHKVLLIDLDPSANATHIFLQEPSELTIKEFLLSKEVMMDCIVKSKSLSIIPSHIRLAMTDKELGNKSFRESLLFKKLHSPYLEDIFDYVIIDCPPNLGTLTINAMFAATFILIPITYEKDALEGVADLFGVLSEIKEGHLYDLRILRNRFDARKKAANNWVNEKLQPFVDGNSVFQTFIRQDESVNRATIEDMTAVAFAPHSNAALDYIALAAELTGILSNG